MSPGSCATGQKANPVPIALGKFAAAFGLPFSELAQDGSRRAPRTGPAQAIFNTPLLAARFFTESNGALLPFPHARTLVEGLLVGLR
jgi:hypothetical protein